jgi:hypothetical protein
MQYIKSITFIQFYIYIYPSPFAEIPLQIARNLSGKNLPAMQSRESNSGLPWSKPTHCQLSYAAP